MVITAGQLVDLPPHVADKVVRDAFSTRGDNRLNPYKNRARRYGAPIVVRAPETTPPEGWVKVAVKISDDQSRIVVEPEGVGWGYYIDFEDWRGLLLELQKRSPIEKPGLVKVGIPYAEAQAEDVCDRIALGLAYQAHRIFGCDPAEIRKKYAHLAEAVEGCPLLQDAKCPFCKDILKLEGFLEAEEGEDPFVKEREGEDDVIQLFHARPLTPGQFLHEPGNVAWAHRRCNVAVGTHSLPETLEWMKKVLQAHGRL